MHLLIPKYWKWDIHPRHSQSTHGHGHGTRVTVRRWSITRPNPQRSALTSSSAQNHAPIFPQFSLACSWALHSLHQAHTVVASASDCDLGFRSWRVSDFEGGIFVWNRFPDFIFMHIRKFQWCDWRCDPYKYESELDFKRDVFAAATSCMFGVLLAWICCHFRLSRQCGSIYFLHPCNLLDHD
jgi:hypothetical protein